MNSNSGKGKRLGIVGCGAATLECHLPALAQPGPFTLTALVDADEANAARAAEAHRQAVRARGAEPGEIFLGTDVSQLVGRVDAAIVATPHFLHATNTIELLNVGIHVLVEKPFAVTDEEAEQILEAAAASEAKVLPGLVRRLYPAAVWVKSVLERGDLGTVRRVTWSEGWPYEWPVRSTSMFRSTSNGGGVLLDTGPHVLDLLVHWFGEPAEVVSAAHNAHAAGSDTEAAFTLRFGEVEAEVELSRLRPLTTGVEIFGDRGSLQFGTRLTTDFARKDASGTIVDSGPVPVTGPAQSSPDEAYEQQLAQFDRLIETGICELASPSEGAAVTRTASAVRAHPRSPLPRPWEGGATLLRPSPGRVAVTGATGFIGTHLTDRLIASESHVTALYHNPARLARLAHNDLGRLTFAESDVRDAGTLARAFAGCEVVVHTAYGRLGDESEQRSVTVGGTEAVMEAAQRAGVRRVVHLSSVAVYDLQAAGAEFDEDSPVVTPDNPSGYAKDKLEAERIVLQGAGRGIEVVCLQPTVVYGPLGWWSIGPLTRLADENEALPSGAGSGMCNPVHVHDVTDAIIFASQAAGLDGDRVLVTGPQPVTWGVYYDGYRRILGLPTHDEWKSEFLDEWESSLYTENSVCVSTRLQGFGFTAGTDLATGMSQVASWADWANYRKS